MTQIKKNDSFGSPHTTYPITGHAINTSMPFEAYFLPATAYSFWLKILTLSLPVTDTGLLNSVAKIM